jgi:hypothetical protein
MGACNVVHKSGTGRCSTMKIELVFRLVFVIVLIRVPLGIKRAIIEGNKRGELAEGRGGVVQSYEKKSVHSHSLAVNREN